MNVSLPLPNDGYFIARCDTVGATEVELTLAYRNVLPDSRAIEIARSTGYAMEMLRIAEPQGRC